MTPEEVLVQLAGGARAFAGGATLGEEQLAAMREQLAAARALLATQPEAERAQREAETLIPLLREYAGALAGSLPELAGEEFWQTMRRVWETQGEIVEVQAGARQASEDAAARANRSARDEALGTERLLGAQARLAERAVALLPQEVRGAGVERLLLPALQREAAALAGRLHQTRDPAERAAIEERLLGVARQGMEARDEVRGADPFRGFFGSRRVGERPFNAQLVFQLQANDPAGLERAVLAILRQQLDAAGVRR